MLLEAPVHTARKVETHWVTRKRNHTHQMVVVPYTYPGRGKLGGGGGYPGLKGQEVYGKREKIRDGGKWDFQGGGNTLQQKKHNEAGTTTEGAGTTGVQGKLRPPVLPPFLPPCPSPLPPPYPFHPVLAPSYPLPESNLQSINVVVPFESVDETLVCDHSNESC